MRINLQPATLNLLILFVLFYMFQYVSPRIEFDFIKYFYLHYPDSPNFRPWQLITHMFSHSGENIMHLLFNGLGLVMFGNIIEQELGTRKFLTLFFISGLGALALHLGIDAMRYYNATGFAFPRINGGINFGDNYPVMCGASGALYGIIVAYAYYFPNQKLIFLLIPYPIKAKYIIPIIILLDLVGGLGSFSGDNIAHWAHLGGALTGFLIVKFWFSRYLKRGW